MLYDALIPALQTPILTTTSIVLIHSCVVHFFYTESLWRHISPLSENSEQFILNHALQQMNSVWQEKTPVHKMCTNEEGWEGRGEDDIRIYVFPPQIFCRAECCKPTMSRNTLYCAHPLGLKREFGEKEPVLKEMKAWFL